MRFINLYFFADSLFCIAPVNHGEKSGIKDHIQDPRYQIAEHNRVDGRKLGVEHQHPKNSEAERKRDTGNTCEQWVAKCLKGVGKDIIDGKDKDEQADVK